MFNHEYDYRPNWTPLSPVTITNSLRSKLFRASFLQETKFVEGKKRGRRGREGLTRAITLLETLVMQARYNIK